jgi:cytoskeletal protein CcmA (bactofilin family)
MTNLSPPGDTRTAARAAGRSVLAADLRITGDIQAEGTVEVMGEVDGAITARGVILSAEGRIGGTITAENVELKGRMQGSIKTGALSLRSTAEVQADVVYTSLAIDSGAQIDGRFSRAKG